MVEPVVVLAPPAQHGVRRGDHDVVHPLHAGHQLGQRGTGQPDAGAELEDVHRAEHLTEDPGHPCRRVHLGRGDLQQRGLAGSVGPQDDPAFVLLHRPVHAIEQGGGSAADRDAGELEGVHGLPIS